MRSGAEVKVGLITLLALALLAAFAVYISRVRIATYTLYVNFENAKGIQGGEPVRMLGVKIGDVRRVTITEDRKAQAELAISQEHRLFRNYVFEIVSTGLIQERYIEVRPTEHGAEGIELTNGATTQGVAPPDLLAAGSEALANLNRTAEQLRTVLGNEEILSGIKKAIASFTAAADAAADLAATASAVAQESAPEARAIIAKLGSAADDLQTTISGLRKATLEGTTLPDMEAAAASLRRTSEKADKLAASADELVSDPKTRAELRETITNLDETVKSLKSFSKQLEEAGPSVPRLAKQAEHFSSSMTQIQEQLKPPEIHGNFDVLYSSRAHRSFSTGSLDFSTGKDHFLRLGIDDIGENTSVNVQLGEQQKLGGLRYGLVRSRLGLGFDLGRPRKPRLSVDVFDPNELRADVLADIPLILGGSDLSLVAGARDLGGGSLFVLGARVRR